MIASQVHAIIAAGLENPTLLARWRREPDLLRQCGVDPNSVDLDALLKFAGLSAKVRHNGLRGDLPSTFRLLNIAGLEIEVFASYATFQSDRGRKYAATAAGRSSDLLLFLEQWLDFRKREQALLWDVIRHEMTLARLRKSCPSITGSVVSTAPKQRRPRGSSVPRICGEIVLHEMRSDPRLVEKLLQRKRPNLKDVSRAAFHFCYWRTAEELFILQFDELGFFLLSMIDGKNSVADIALLIHGRRQVTAGLANALSELVALRIVTFN
ncbi:MAG TPA: hypothetical protein VLL54_00615 [Pyrinomonadaceae bacterium]|nr:hypothetical protein [Pyrinomonadaceae bacterium]